MVDEKKNSECVCVFINFYHFLRFPIIYIILADASRVTCPTINSPIVVGTLITNHRPRHRQRLVINDRQLRQIIIFHDRENYGQTDKFVGVSVKRLTFQI